MHVKLSLCHSNLTVRELEADDFPLIIGRSPTADISLNDRWASREHCELAIQDGLVWVRDLDSKHGTRVNDARISRAPIRPGDRLNIGLSCFVAEYVTTLTEIERHFEPACDGKLG